MQGGIWRRLALPSALQGMWIHGSAQHREQELPVGAGSCSPEKHRAGPGSWEWSQGQFAKQNKGKAKVWAMKTEQCEPVSQGQTGVLAHELITAPMNCGI